MPSPRSWDAPHIRDLNEGTGLNDDSIGVKDTSTLDFPRLVAESERRWTAEYDRIRQPEFRSRGVVLFDLRLFNPKSSFEAREN